MTSDEAAEKWLAVHAEIQPLIRARKFAEACALLSGYRDEAAARADNELAASLSTLLATCLTMDCRHEEALRAAEAAETLDASSVDAKLTTARVLLNCLRDSERARDKAQEILCTLPFDDPFRCGALAMFGTALARCGDVDGAVDVFREMTTPEMLASLRSAEYVGVFDLQLVTELVRAGAARGECRRYLLLVKSAPNMWPRVEQQLDELLLAVGKV